MGLREHPLQMLGKKVAEVEDHVLLGSVRLKETKRRMVFLPEAYTKKPRPASVVWVGALGVAAAAAAAMLMFLTSSNLTVTVDGQSLVEGDFVSSYGAKEKELRFSDGSVVRLAGRSGVRVRELHSNGALVFLERGTFEVDIRHAGKTDWRFDVGPYRVFVTGTRFTVNWKPEEELFELNMAEGTVRVSGPMIATEKLLRKGERLRASLAFGRLTQVSGETLLPAAPSPVLPAAVASAESQPEATATVDGPTTGESEASTVKPAASVSWQQLARRGKYKDAAALAKKSNVDGILRSASAPELIALGDAARHAGDAALAVRAYSAVRERYADSSHASNAAFALGIMAFDGEGGSDAALRWFRVVEKERSDSDGLAKEASGRILECLNKSGDHAGASAAARRYLSRYPDGPHAPLARALTE